MNEISPKELSSSNKTTAIILAAGQGKRMGTAKNKVLCEICGIPMIECVYQAVIKIINTTPIIVVSPDHEDIKEIMGEKVRYAIQDKPLGTGHAAMAAIEMLEENTVNQIVLLYGDMPFITSATIEDLIRKRQETNACIALVSMIGEKSSTFGRIISNHKGEVLEVIEWADAKQRPDSEKLLSIRELNAGLYCFEYDWFCRNIRKIVPRPSREYDEYYLTDIFRIASEQSKDVVVLRTINKQEFFGISTRKDLNLANKIASDR